MVLKSSQDWQKDMIVVGEARSGQEAVKGVGELEPDIILMDIEMPTLDGLQATQQICGKERKAKVVILAGSYNDHLLRTALANGAHGYVAKHEGLLELPMLLAPSMPGRLTSDQVSPNFCRPPVNRSKNHPSPRMAGFFFARRQNNRSRFTAPNSLEYIESARKRRLDGKT
jgi:DNA-binding NarL/FixJ family response regulator